MPVHINCIVIPKVEIRTVWKHFDHSVSKHILMESPLQATHYAGSYEMRDAKEKVNHVLLLLGETWMQGKVGAKVKICGGYAYLSMHTYLCHLYAHTCVSAFL